MQLLLLRSWDDMPGAENTGWIENRARKLATIAQMAVDGGWYHVHFPQNFAGYLRVPRTQDVVPVCLALTKAPNCPTDSGWLRVLCFETAIVLLRTHKTSILGSSTALKQTVDLQSTWKNDPDGAIGWLALSWHDTNT